jgi:hypothetical protein
MEPNQNLDLQKKIEEQGIKIDAIYKSLEKIRWYFKVMAWVTILAVVLPMIGLAFAIPAFMHSYVDQLGGLGI